MSPEFSPNLGKSEKSRKHPGISNFPRIFPQILLNKGGTRLTLIFAFFCTPASAFTDEKNSFRAPAFFAFSGFWSRVKNPRHPGNFEFSPKCGHQKKEKSGSRRHHPLFTPAGPTPVHTLRNTILQIWGAGVRVVSERVYAEGNSILGRRNPR